MVQFTRRRQLVHLVDTVATQPKDVTVDQAVVLTGRGGSAQAWRIVPGTQRTDRTSVLRSTTDTDGGDANGMRWYVHLCSLA